MSIINNIFYDLGYYGPNILILLSIYLLWNHNNLFFYYSIGIIIDSIINTILKGIIQEPRPNIISKEFSLALKNNKRYLYKDGLPFDVFGMPSGHASSVIFSTVFVYLALKKTKWLYVYLIISAIIISQRVVYQYHTVSQVIVGSFTGALIAYILFQLTEKKLKGRIREKPDDNGPV